MNAYDDNPRTLLGELLQQARVEARLTQDSVGAATGVDRTAVSRMEGGSRLPTRDILTAWLGKCEVGQGTLGDAGIRAMWRVARRRSDGDEPAQIFFAGWTDAEAAAWTLRYWQPDLVPGILQTEKYAYQTFRVYGLSHDQATEAAKARMERQKILERAEPPSVIAVIDEVVLTRQLGDREVMAEQCERLLQAWEYPTVLLQVVQGASAGLGGALALAEGPTGSVVLSASLLEDIVTADAGQVRRASTIVDSVRAAAESVTRSRVILEERARSWTA
jgi:transcriptional regulator with XRE-family HTH domain